MCGIGSALVDVLVETSVDTLVSCGLVKGSMQLMDLAAADAVHALVPGGLERSGGSVANSIAGLAALGARAAMLGRIADDRLGGVFATDMTELGVAFGAQPVVGAGGTGRCLVLITPDAERTMCTSLGVASQLGPSDLDLDLIGRSAITYLEGYLWDEPQAIDAFGVAISTAHAAGRRAAMSLSDSFCVDRHRAEFAELVASDLDIVLGNEGEMCSLMETSSLEEACALVRRPGLLVTVTRGAGGAIAFDGTDGPVVSVDAPAGVKVVDTTGAGDLYAAGFLYGLTHGLDLGASVALGNAAAAECISHVGARPEIDLSTLV